MSVYKDADGVWHKILTTEHVTIEVVQERATWLKETIAKLEAELKQVEIDLEHMTNGRA